MLSDTLKGSVVILVKLVQVTTYSYGISVDSFQLRRLSNWVKIWAILGQIFCTLYFGGLKKTIVASWEELILWRMTRNVSYNNEMINQGFSLWPTLNCDSELIWWLRIILRQTILKIILIPKFRDLWKTNFFLSRSIFRNLSLKLIYSFGCYAKLRRRLTVVNLC